MKNYKYYLNEDKNEKIIFIRKEYTDEFKNLKDLGSEIFDYIWTDTDKYEPFDKIKDLKNRLIWYRGPIEDKKWRDLVSSISKDNTILNDPLKCFKVASKVKFYKENSDFKYLPKVWFKPEDAEYPCVEKPDNSFSGKGVRVVKTAEEVDKENGDLWMEKIDFETEWRIWLFRDEILGTYWRKHIKGIEDKKSGDKVDFEYIEKDLPGNMEDIKEIIEYCYKKYNLDFCAIDLFFKDGKWYLCEVNSQPGYKETVWKRTIKRLKSLRDEIIR